MPARPAVPPVSAVPPTSARTTPRLAALVAACLLLATVEVGAAGLGPVLKGSPFEFFTEEDTNQFIAAARALAVSDAPDETKRWANEASGSWGTMAVKRKFTRNGAPCKDIRGENTARGRTEPFRLILCRTPQGEWKIASSGPVKK